MHSRCMYPTGDDFHWLVARSVTADVPKTTALLEQPPMPGEQRHIAKWFGKRAIQVDHHLRDALFG